MPFTVDEEPHHEVRELAVGRFGEVDLIMHGHGEGTAMGQMG